MQQFRSPVKRKRFLEKFAETGNVTTAALYAGATRAWAYRLRKTNEKFKKEWDEAEQEACDRLEEEARRRAVDGVKKFVYYKGKPVGKINEYSDLLLICLLRAHRPEKFDRRSVDPPSDTGLLEKLRQLGQLGPAESPGNEPEDGDD